MPMRKNQSGAIFHKLLVPVFYECGSGAAIEAAQMMAGDVNVVLVGLVGVPAGDSLSTAAVPAQKVRQELHRLAAGIGAQVKMKVRASHQLWDELVEVIQEEQPDLLIMEWPCHFDAFGIDSNQVLSQTPCDIAVVRGPIKRLPARVLVPLRGGPYAELALRLSLAVNRQEPGTLTALHLTSFETTPQQDAPFRGLAQVLANLPEVDHVSMRTDDPAGTILEESQRYDLVIMGVSAQQPEMQPALGGVVKRLLLDSPAGVIAVKSKRAIPPDLHSELVGKSAISVLVDKWFAENTYFADEFQNLELLMELKKRQNMLISLAMPALNEEETIGNVIGTIKRQLMDEIPLLDEMVLIDSNSTDRTRQIARDLGIPVYIHQQVLPQHGSRRGKGEALWKSLYVTRGDILLWIDTDIENIHPRFVYGLLGALLSNPQAQFVKGFYRRPIKVGEKIQAGGGGRVTELTARPLLNMFYPELSGVVQPLSGEYGGRRSALEQLPFFSGYGVEIGLLIDIFERFGLEAIAQVDLLERIHHNQPLEALSKMSFLIMQAVFSKLEKKVERSLLQEVNKTMKLIRYKPGHFFLDVEEIVEMERPPIASLTEYQEKKALWRA